MYRKIMNKNITLLNIRVSNTVFMPLGILYLASELEKNGFSAQLFDVFTQDDKQAVIESIKSFGPEYIGFSVTTPTYSKTKEFMVKLKDVLPNSIYFAGGAHPTVCARECIDNGDFDFVVVGEGERSLLEALDNLGSNKSLLGVNGVAFKDQNGLAVVNQKRDLIDDLNSISFPARHLLDVDKYFIPPGYIRSYFLNRVANVLTSRGCPMLCTFCCSHYMFGRGVRQRSVENVMSEIDELIANSNIDGIYFSDETFTVNHKWVFNLCDEMEKRKLSWGCATRIDLISDPLIKRMKETGCVQIDTGIESGSDAVLKRIKKNTTNEKIRKAFKIFKKYRMRTFATLMAGTPGETKDDLLQTKKLLQDIKPTYTLISWFTPFVGTQAYDDIAENFEDKSCLQPDNYDFVTADKPMVNATEMSMDELMDARSMLQRTVFVGNYMSMITMHNIRYILEALFVSLCSPREFVKALGISIRRRSWEYLAYSIFYIYQNKQMESSCK